MILRRKSRACEPDADELSEMNAYLQQHAEVQQDAELQWEATRTEKAELDKQVEFEARRGCGLRSCWAGATSAFRHGDLVFAPPTGASTQPGVAVVLEVESAFGFGAEFYVPTGQLRLLPWDVQNLKFSSSLRCSDQVVVFLPPCCGRGADCPHLSIFAEPRQWPDGHEMDLSILLSIPASLANYLRTELRQPRLNQQQEMEMGFKTLLGAHYCAPTDSTPLGKRTPLAPSTSDAPCKQQKLAAEPAVECMSLQLAPLGLVPCTIGANGRDSDSESSDSQVLTVEGASVASESDHELDHQDLYDEDQLQYEAALDSDAYCSDGSW